MQFTVYEAELIVNPSLPYLVASPDRKVFDPTEKYGGLEGSNTNEKETVNNKIENVNDEKKA